MEIRTHIGRTGRDESRIHRELFVEFATMRSAPNAHRVKRTRTDRNEAENAQIAVKSSVY
jgi:hypothetical protein